MKYYEELLDLQTFTRTDLVKLTGSEAAAMSLIYDYQKKGYIERVKRDYCKSIQKEDMLSDQDVIKTKLKNICRLMAIP